MRSGSSLERADSGARNPQTPRSSSVCSSSLAGQGSSTMIISQRQSNSRQQQQEQLEQPHNDQSFADTKQQQQQQTAVAAAAEAAKSGGLNKRASSVVRNSSISSILSSFNDDDDDLTAEHSSGSVLERVAASEANQEASANKTKRASVANDDSCPTSLVDKNSKIRRHSSQADRSLASTGSHHARRSSNSKAEMAAGNRPPIDNNNNRDQKINDEDENERQRGGQSFDVNNNDKPIGANITSDSKNKQQPEQSAIKSERENGSAGAATPSPPLPASQSQMIMGGASGRSSGPGASQPGSAGGGAQSKSPVDCPYVHDLLVLSPNPACQSPIQPAPSFQPHSARLSHDDTMEAIEDDVEGEELEQRLLMQQQQQLKNNQQEEQTSSRILQKEASFNSSPSFEQAVADLSNTPLPPGFGGSFELLNNNNGSRINGGENRPMTPADSIKEEEENDFDQDDLDREPVGCFALSFEAPPPPELPTPSDDPLGGDSDEESSISISHRGVIVSSTTAIPTNQSQLTGNDDLTPPAENSPEVPSPQKQLAQKDSTRNVMPASTLTSSSGEWPVKSMSNESATQAILDHMALHQVGVGEPGPVLSPSPISMANDATLTRRASWRQRQGNEQELPLTGKDCDLLDNDGAAGAQPLDEWPTGRGTAIAVSPAAEGTGCEKNSHELTDESQTATMKRRRVKKSSIEGGQGEDSSEGPSKKMLAASDSLETAQGSQEDIAAATAAAAAEAAATTTTTTAADSQRVAPDDGSLSLGGQVEPLPGGVPTGSDQCPSDPMDPSLRPSSSNSNSASRRGPPLSQLRASELSSSIAQKHDTNEANSLSLSDNYQTNNNNNNYDSICSSCSCRDASSPSDGMINNQQQSQRVGSLATASSTALTPKDGTGSVGGGSSASVASAAAAPHSNQWTSQEEGTVYTENYWLSHWLYISEHEESEVWRRAIDMTSSSCSSGSSSSPGQADTNSVPPENLIDGLPKEMNEFESTSSESNFNTKYKSTTRKMIHRRATIELYRRKQEGTLKPEKRVEINRSNGEFGFRIHGSRPVVVSAIERGTSAESCGLEVGDLIYAINGTNILDMAHSDVVRLAHNAQSSYLILDLIPTNDFLQSNKYNRSMNQCYEPSFTGFLMRLSPSTAQPLLVDLQNQLAKSSGVSTAQRVAKLTRVLRLAWRRRYFVLRNDNCLYWFKSMNDIEPQGGINLQGFSATITSEFSEPSYVIRLIKYGGQPHYFGTNKLADLEQWIDAINRAATEANQNDPYMRRTLTLARLKPNQIDEPDCNGFLYKYSRKRDGGAHWKPVYFVLKDACLYLYRNGPLLGSQSTTTTTTTTSSSTTSGENTKSLGAAGSELAVVGSTPSPDTTTVISSGRTTTSASTTTPTSSGQASAVVYLHGYRVRSKNIERKRHTFELIPPTRKTMRAMFLMASSDIDKKRWIAALEYTIDRWIEID